MERERRDRIAGEDTSCAEPREKPRKKNRRSNRNVIETYFQKHVADARRQCEHNRPRTAALSRLLAIYDRLPGAKSAIDFAKNWKNVTAGCKKARISVKTTTKTTEVRALVCPCHDIHLFRGPCALSASIYVTLYTGPFRPLSVCRNTGFYQLLRRAPITGKL